jgi:glycyl-tRNA synthetase beta subunit
VIRILLQTRTRLPLRRIIARARFIVWSDLGNADIQRLLRDVRKFEERVGSEPGTMGIEASWMASLTAGKGKSQAEFDEMLAEAAGTLLAFFADRLKVLLRDQGQRHDLVDAVFALGDDDMVRIVAKVNALGAFLGTEDGANLLAGYKRAVNILKAEEKKGPLPEGEPVDMPGASAEEAALIDVMTGLADPLYVHLTNEDFAGAMGELARLRGPVDAFFDKVLVNSDVPAERENRLRLLAKVRDAMGRVADFGQVTG